MSKNVLNQRYCYKLNSDYIKRNKGSVKLTDVKSAIKNRFVVGMGDSDGVRMIREIVKSEYTEEYINNLKGRIKYELKNGGSAKLISELNEKVLIASLQSELCNVVFKSDGDYNKYTKEGFKLNGNKYVVLLGSSGGIKQNTVLFIREDLKDEVNRRNKC